MGKFIKEALIMPDLKVTLWTDSNALGKSTSRNWKSFVQNRVEDIQSLHEPSIWRKCPGDQNPADLSSRGGKIKQLINNQLWWKGPLG